MLFNSLIQSYMNNGILLWGVKPGRLSTLQNKAIRAITLAKWNQSYKKLNILKVEDVYRLRSLKFLHSLQNETAPQYFLDNYDLFNNDPNNRPTRTITASQCLKWKLIYEIIPQTENIILEKLSTHSYDGFTAYAKRCLIEAYAENCEVDNCFSCQQLRLSSPRTNA